MEAVAVCIGTLTGREEYLEQVVEAWEAQDDCVVFVGVLKDKPLGTSWNMLAESAFMAEWLIFAADDQEPWPGALDSALTYLHANPGCVAGFRLHQNGEPLDAGYDAKLHGEQTSWARCWLLHRTIYRQVGPFLELSWYLDIDYSQRLTEAGFPIRMVDGFGGDHLDAPRDWLNPTEQDRQYQAYLAACATGNRSPFV